MGRNVTMKSNQELLRRLRSGAVLILFSKVVLACGDGDKDPSGPDTPEPPVDEGQGPTPGCTDGTLAHGALFRICFPDTWNGDLVLFAHGYVAPQRELVIPQENVGGQPVSALITSLGYAYATTSYRANGLVAPEAVDDLLELVDTVDQRYRPDPARRVIVGFSEGGLVATLGAERHPDRFDGALAGCGPIGDLAAQLNYLDDFRVVFDYFYPGLLPGNALEVPESVRDQWDELYVPAIVLALAANPGAAHELLAVTQAPVAGDDLRSIAETTVGILWYNVFGTADAQQRLGGQPFDNSTRVYAGSSDDAALNAGVERFHADAAVLSGLTRFATSGDLSVPLVNLHTTGDPIVPFSQAGLYADKVIRGGTADRFTQIDIERFGHCTFEAPELLSAFDQLWQKIGPRPAASRMSLVAR
jgi:pimeloyl-ACP methyl ester carboxylesterase